MLKGWVAASILGVGRLRFVGRVSPLLYSRSFSPASLGGHVMDVRWQGHRLWLALRWDWQLWVSSVPLAPTLNPSGHVLGELFA